MKSKTSKQRGGLVSFTLRYSLCFRAAVVVALVTCHIANVPPMSQLYSAHLLILVLPTNYGVWGQEEPVGYVVIIRRGNLQPSQLVPSDIINTRIQSATQVRSETRNSAVSASSL